MPTPNPERNRFVIALTFPGCPVRIDESRHIVMELGIVPNYSIRIKLKKRSPTHKVKLPC